MAYTLYGDTIGSGLQDEYKRQEEEKIKKGELSKFNPAKVVPALIETIVTKNPAPFILAVTGEGARSASGSDTDLASLAQASGKFLPKFSAGNTVTSMQPVKGTSTIPGIDAGGDAFKQVTTDKNYLQRINPFDFSNYTQAPLTSSEQDVLDKEKLRISNLGKSSGLVAGKGQYIKKTSTRDSVTGLPIINDSIELIPRATGGAGNRGKFTNYTGLVSNAVMNQLLPDITDKNGRIVDGSEQVKMMVKKGMTMKDIADHFGLSPEVEYY
jgi:hypothetical protein